MDAALYQKGKDANAILKMERGARQDWVVVTRKKFDADTGESTTVKDEIQISAVQAHVDALKAQLGAAESLLKDLQAT